LPLLPLLDLPQSGTSASSCDSCFTRTSMANVIYIIKQKKKWKRCDAEREHKN
jgi:hypothetical protein